MDADWNAVGIGVADLLGAVDDARGKQQTNGDAELVSGDESATDLARALNANNKLVKGGG